MKKYIAWDVFHLSLILSLLRLYPELYRSSSLQNLEPLGREEILGQSSAYTQTNFHHNLNNRLHGYIHPKNFDDSVARTLFINDLNSLINRPHWEVNPPQNNIFAYILNDQLPVSSVGDQTTNNNRTTVNGDNALVRNQSDSLENHEDSGLTQEEMDLIEVLWKQDIDLGISRDAFDGTWQPENQKSQQQELYKENLLKNKSENVTLDKSESFPNPWDGLAYRIDSETGEHIILQPPNSTGTSQSFQEVPTDSYDDITLEEALQLFENDYSKPIEDKASVSSESYTGRATSPDFEESFYAPKREENITLDASTSVLPPLPLSIDTFDLSLEDENIPLLDQLQEISNLALESRALNDSHRNTWPTSAIRNDVYNSNASNSSFGMGASNINYAEALLQNSTLPTAMDNNTNTDDLLDQFLLSLMSNDSDPPDPVPSLPDQVYDIPIDFLRENYTRDNDFLSMLNEEMNFMDEDVLPILPDDDPHDDVKNSTLTAQAQAASNDSAVSCLGSDNECHDAGMTYQGIERNWNARTNEGGTGTSSDSSVSYSGMNLGASYTEKKYTPSDGNSNDYSSDSGCGKNYQRFDGMARALFGSSASFNEGASNAGSKSASGSSRPINSFMHNHTYPKEYHSEDSSNEPPFERDKKPYNETRDRRNSPESLDGSEGYHSSRDEKRARELNLPLTAKEITSMPIDEFNERLSKFELNDEQLTLIRDIRRRGKNKIAAQNCRKRKMDQIFELQQTLEDLELEREKLTNEQSVMSRRRDFLQSKFNKLYRYICDMSPGPPDPPGYFPNRSVDGGRRPTQSFSLVNNSSSYSNLENGGDNSGHGGARVKRKINKNN